MGKKFYNTRCVYCLREFETLTSDHIFPKSWYPETTPANLEKWQVPACGGCNQKYSQLEEYLLTRLGMCLDPNNPRAKGIGEKVIRSLTPKYGRGSLDTFMRKKKLKKFVKEIRPVSKMPREGRLPGLKLAPGADEAGIAIPISQSQLKEMGEKVVRGLVYYHYQQYIEKDHIVEVWFPYESAAQRVIGMLEGVGKKYEREPGIDVTIGLASDDPQSALFFIEIWGQYKMYATIMPKEEEY
jgi:hypothetical protein